MSKHNDDNNKPMLSDTEHLKQKQYLAEENFNDEAYLSAINTQRLIQELRNLPIELEMQNIYTF